MKSFLLINVTVFIALLVVSCEPTPPPPPPGPSETPGGNTLTLTPVLNTMPEITQVEFLIDNSNSVEDVSKGGCGERLGKGRFEFVRFVTGIFRDSIPNQYSQNLYIGVGTFGTQYTSLLSPISLNIPFSIPTPDTPTNNTKYTLGIQGALSKIYNQNQVVKRRYLIIITDGETETESVETVEAELIKQTINHNDPDLHIFIALLCPRNSQNWLNKVHQLDIADVFVGLESVAKHLFDSLNGFLPMTGELILSTNDQSSIQVVGDATSISFSYWSPDVDAGNYLGIYDTSVNFSKSLTSLETYQHTVFPLPGCHPHSFVIDPPPTNNWFLFVQPQTFQNLKFTITSSNEEVIEIINGNPLSFQFEISDSLLDVDISKWRDCFSAKLIWSTSNQLNQANSGEVDFVPCEGVQFLCYTETQWSPGFTDKGDMEIKVKLETLNGTTWESESKIFPIKFSAKYDFINSMPFTVNDQQIVEKDFVFNDVSSASQVDIYLVSSTGKLDDSSCPNPTHIVNDLKARQLMLVSVEQCEFHTLSDTASGNRVCISYSGQAPLDYVYTLHAYDRITKVDCQYDQLYFEWRSDEYTKEMTWLCDFRKNKDCVNISKPIVTLYP